MVHILLSLVPARAARGHCPTIRSDSGHPRAPRLPGSSARGTGHHAVRPLGPQPTGSAVRDGSSVSSSNCPAFHQSSIMFQKSISEEL